MNTVAAIATPVGISAIAVVRMTGDDCLEIASRVFKRKNNQSVLSIPANTVTFGCAYDQNSVLIDECLLTYFKAPASYTGEDIIEISCHGGIDVTARLLEALILAGAVQAPPGEFTKRAYLNGKMDLSGSEAVIDIINADNKNAARLALLQRGGSVYTAINGIINNLELILARFFAYIDYPDDEIEDTTTEQIKKELEQIINKCDTLIASFERGSIAKNGIDTVILGKPNSGKSSLMNYLTKQSTSIVTDIAGTTRDIIQSRVIFGGITLNLSDTAGIRSTADTVEKIGVERAYEKADEAQLILMVFDYSSPLTDEDKQLLEYTKGKTVIGIINKSDLMKKTDLNLIKSVIKNCFSVSVLKETGLDKVEEYIKQLYNIGELLDDGSEIISSIRHKNCLIQGSDRLSYALSAVKEGYTADAIVSEIEEAVSSLGEITGRTVTDETVQKIFENFCVGK